MNRHQRRAARAKAKDHGDFHEIAGRYIGAVKAEDMKDERRYLLASTRPMQMSDMLEGYTYEPGLTLLRIELPATPDLAGCWVEIPILVPPELREPSPENTQAILAIACVTDPETKKIVDEMRARARPWKEVQAARDLPKEVLGRFVIPPTNPTEFGRP